MKRQIPHIDCWLYVLIAITGQLVATFTTDEAIKIIGSTACFWVKAICGVIGAGTLAAKMYRSTAYGDQKTKDSNGNTVMITKQ